MKTHTFNQDDLPSRAQLIRSTKRAFFVAFAILIIFVLPAEYGIDPTFLWRAFGLTEMGKIKVSLQKDIEAQKEKMLASQQNDQEEQPIVKQNLNSETGVLIANNVDADSGLSGNIELKQVTNTQPKTDTLVVEIAPDEWLEIKAFMTKGQAITYEWNVDVWHLNFDAHGESDAGDVAVYGEWRKETSGKWDITATFDGKHWWFFRNRAGEVVTLTLTVSWTYQELKQLD